jgi:hypothetical protein
LRAEGTSRNKTIGTGGYLESLFRAFDYSDRLLGALEPRRHGGTSSLCTHVADEILRDGRFDMQRFRSVARLRYYDHTVVREVFTMARSGDLSPRTHVH